jgi:DNA-binding MarR family transcriptional regulator
MARGKGPGPAPLGPAPLSPLIHGRVRLLLLSRLVAMPTAHPFTELRSALHVTDGVLSVNLTKLEQAGLVTVEKTYEGRRPRTLVRLTAEGLAQYHRYVEDLRAVVSGLAGR